MTDPKINRAFEDVVHGLLRAPGRMTNTRNDFADLANAIYLYLFCRWDWRGARRYARLCADYRRTHPIGDHHGR